MKTGLVLEGGAMRGLFTAGIMDVWMENGIPFDGAIGVSAGAAFGCNYKSGQIGRVLRYNKRFVQDKRYCGLGVLWKTGNYYSTDFCYEEVPLKYDVFDFEAYQKNPMEFFVVCTDIRTGKPVYHKFLGKPSEGFDWIRASASMPLVSEIVRIDELELLDGGVSDSVPLRHFQSLGYEKNVVVLTREKEYRKKRNLLMPLIRHKYKAYPQLIAALERRHEMYNETLSYIEEQEQAGKIVVLRPEEALPVQRTERNPEKLQQTYDIGRAQAQKRLEEVQSFLK